jgi:ABC-type transport system involved in multi-copper enzyme maturation permease subunit
VLFMGLNRTLLFAFWILVPLITADCVSREKREGTLGLLFLTPLTVFDVIASKAAIHVLRALTLFLAALPLLGLPLFLGGVDWRWLLLATLGQANAVLLGIAGGLYASTRGGSTIQVMVMAEGWALGLVVFSRLVTRGLVYALMGTPWRLGWLLNVVGTNTPLSLILFVLLLWASVRRLRATWHQDSPSPEQPGWVKLFSNSEFWQDFFRWDKRGTLNRNPIAWLQEYSWTARLTKWGWVVVVLVTEFVLLTRYSARRSPLLQPLVTVAFGLGIAFSAAGSFRREQETGLLELLLVTPLSVRQLLGGRLWGICCHYLPALAILWVGWSGDRLLNPTAYRNEFIGALFPHPAAFILLVVLGLYFSLGRLNFFLAWFLTWLIAVAVPILGRIGLARFAGVHPGNASGLAITLQLGLAALLWALLHRKVRQREFVVLKGDPHRLG